MIQAISVSKLNTYIKQIFDAEELLHNIAVVGEVFGVSTSRNVIYFSLKDENATLPCVCFYPNYIDFIKEGNKVIVTGSPNFYIKGGKLSFNVVKVENVGQGKLYEEFIKLKQKLADEGLFDQSHKKTIPKDIKRIGVITSREGAVIQDIKNVSWRRNPSVDIVLYNTKVQGNNAENEIANAIDKLGQYPNIDVIIVARGGGSLEDLWAYNTEIVAKATYNCPKPIISAVGHETDFTIIDFVSDLRAPTTSAAAELLTFNLEDKKLAMKEIFNKFFKTCKNYINTNISLLNSQGYFLSINYEKNLINQKIQLEKMKNSLVNNIDYYFNQKCYELGLKENTLQKINPKEILLKGYAKVEQNGQSVKTIENVNIRENLNIIFKDGMLETAPIKKEKINEIK